MSKTRSQSQSQSIIRLSGLLLASLGFLAACGDEGAPGIPHAITAQSDAYCLGCHQSGSNGAPRTPHPQRTGCTGCHAPR